MLNPIVVSIRFIILILAGQEQVALENAALRHQLAVFKRSVPRPKLNNRDRLFWIGLYMVWQGWESALIFVRPETVTCWASRAVQTVLAELIPTEKRRPTRNAFRYPETDPFHGNRQSDVGNTTGSRGTEEARI